MSRLGDEIRGATGFLTILPVLPRGPGPSALAPTTAPTPPPLARSVRWFPLAGGVVGLGLWAVDALLGYGLPPFPRSALVLIGAAVITGALHLDGLADTCDGLLSRAPRERALEVMKDTNLGAGGAVGLVLVLLAKLSLVAALPVGQRGPALLLMSVAGRQAMTLAVSAFPGARPGEGLGAAVARRIGGLDVGVSLACSIALAAAAGWVAGSVRPAAALVAGVVGGSAVAWGLARRFGGVTGDICGAINEATEVMFLLAAVWGA